MQPLHARSCAPCDVRRATCLGTSIACTYLHTWVLTRYHPRPLQSSSPSVLLGDSWGTVCAMCPLP
jgi:hypothetical protein